MEGGEGEGSRFVLVGVGWGEEGGPVCGGGEGGGGEVPGGGGRVVGEEGCLFRGGGGRGGGGPGREGNTGTRIAGLASGRGFGRRWPRS